MNSDIYFEKGTAHSICEDYALCGNSGNIHYVIGSDGCSSSEGVDVGNRLLCHSAKTAIEYIVKSYNYYEIALYDFERIVKFIIISKSITLMKELNLNCNNFDATLLILISDGKRNIIIIWGDGCAIFRYKNKTKVISIEYEKGAPYYLSYYMNDQKNQNYINTYGNSFIFKHEYTKNGAGAIIEQKINNRTDWYYIDEIYSVNDDPVQCISICSDGIHTYCNTDNEYQSIFPIIDRYVDYKSFNGNFVKRRMNKISKENEKNRIYHYDDIFCGTIGMME